MSEHKGHGGLISAAMRNAPPSSLEKGGDLLFVKLVWCNAPSLHPLAQIGYQPQFGPSGLPAIALLGEERGEVVQVWPQRSSPGAGERLLF
jgi:hypothetical protein